MESTYFQSTIVLFNLCLLVCVINSEDIPVNVVDKSIKINFEDITIGIGEQVNPII